MNGLFNRVLVLGAHTDDEFGCSGTIVRLIEEGKEVYYMAFSPCEESVPKGFPPDILKKECFTAVTKLGVRPENWRLLDFRVRRFPEFRQEILEELVRCRQQLNPDLVFLPASSDIHQDHRVIFEEGLRAFKYTSILGYELPMNTLTFRHVCFVPLEERHIQRKIESLASYQSQRFRSYTSEDFIRSLARVRGVQAGVQFAEAFEVVRWIWK
ncbi:PIG-L family deacetylase [candidate division WOR-3 bacterium]|nr:PIG-L family deacetylase [candidate division WOR-3 bacterium]